MLVCFVCVCGWQVCIVRNSDCLAVAGLKFDLNILKRSKIPTKGPHLGPLGAGTAQCPDDRITAAGNRSPRSSTITEYCGSHRRILEGTFFFSEHSAAWCVALLSVNVVVCVCAPDMINPLCFCLRMMLGCVNLSLCLACQSDEELERFQKSAVEAHRCPRVPVSPCPGCVPRLPNLRFVQVSFAVKIPTRGPSGAG